MNEVIERLKEYKQKAARIRVLSRYYNGSGVVSKPFQEDDELHRMHSKWRIESYLTAEEKQLVQTARDYIAGSPTGSRSQLDAVPKIGVNEGDTCRLREIRDKIKRVMAERQQSKNDMDTVLDRVVELQELQAELHRIDIALEELATYKPQYSKLLKLRYIEGLSVTEVSTQFAIVRKTFSRWKIAALKEFERLFV